MATASKVKYAAYVEGRKSVYMRQGVAVPPDASVAKAIKMAKLDWKVGLVPAAAIIDGKPVLADHRYAVVREDTGRIFDFVGQGYTPVQNTDAMGIADDLRTAAGVKFDNAGDLADGRVVWLQVSMPEGFKVGGEDAYDLYGLIETSHDGKRAVRFHITPIRLACRNMANLAMREARQRWTIRHTARAPERLVEAQQAAGLIDEYVAEFQDTSEQLLKKKMTEKATTTFLETLLPDRPKREKEIAAINDLAFRSETNVFGKGTAYGALQAAREYFDWVRPQRSDESAFIGAVTGVNARTANRAVDLLL